MWLVRYMWRFRVGGGIVLALILCTLSACGAASPRTTHFGLYVSRLCEAIRPFELDGQKLGRVLGTYRPGTKSRRSEQVIVNILTAVIADSRHAIATLEAIGAPDISNGRELATRMDTTFDQIAQSDEAWRSELRAGTSGRPITSRAKRERLRTSLEAVLLIGHQFEGLPRTPERQDAMARSPTCRYVFGPIRVNEQKDG